MLESGVIKMVERDEQGRVVSEIFYDEIRNVRLTALFYEYDSDGRLISEFQDDGYGNYIKIKYWHNENSKYHAYHEKEIHNNGFVKSYFKEYFYDADGKIIKENAVFKDSELFYSTEYFYDDDGNLIKSISYDNAGSDTEICEYELSDNTLVKKYYDCCGIMYLQIKYDYNEKNQVVYEEISDRFIKKTYEHFYDSDGYEVSQLIKYYSENHGTYHYVDRSFIYDESGRLIYSTEKNSDFSKLAYFYNETGRQIVEDAFSEKDGVYYLTRYVSFGLQDGNYFVFYYDYDKEGRLLSQRFQRIDGKTIDGK